MFDRIVRCRYALIRTENDQAKTTQAEEFHFILPNGTGPIAYHQRDVAPTAYIGDRRYGTTKNTGTEIPICLHFSNDGLTHRRDTNQHREIADCSRDTMRRVAGCFGKCGKCLAISKIQIR